MANNPYVNKVQLADGTTVMDITPTTATASDVLSGKYFFTANGTLTLGTNSGGSGDGYVWQDGNGYVHLSEEEGTQPIYDTLNVNASGTFTPAQGHAFNSVVVPSGTAGTPTATKGTVSNHSVSVTPSVTNTTGYITGSTKTGTAVSVSASELVSGTYSVTSSGTKNVANYESASVPAGTVTAPSSISGTSATVSTGTNTLTLSKTVSVTPSVTTAGYVSSGTSGNSSVSLTASVNTRSSSDLSASGATVTAPAGYYASSASKSVASGTEGTPTATKGTVSNHSISVTPSVTNTAGYISGGTKTGTAVTVSVSELESGTKSITENGTGISVSGYSSVNVAVAGGALVTGTFTTGSTRATRESVSINYTGGGYPMAFIVYTSDSVSTGDVRSYSATKNNDTAPTWTTAADSANTTSVQYIYYNGTTYAGMGPNTTAASFIGAQYTASTGYNCVKFIGNSTTLQYYIGNNTSSTAGLAPGKTYSYIIVYS